MSPSKRSTVLHRQPRNSVGETFNVNKHALFGLIWGFHSDVHSSISAGATKLSHAQCRNRLRFFTRAPAQLYLSHASASTMPAPKSARVQPCHAKGADFNPVWHQIILTPLPKQARATLPGQMQPPQIDPQLNVRPMAAMAGLRHHRKLVL